MRHEPKDDDRIIAAGLWVDRTNPEAIKSVSNPIQVEPSVWAWPPELNKIADVVLAYKPKLKTLAGTSSVTQRRPGRSRPIDSKRNTA